MDTVSFGKEDSKKNRIFLTALDLFTRRGFGVTISEIAQAAGISQGLMYRYYESKDALIAQIARIAAESALESMAQLFGGAGNAYEKITAASRMMAEAVSGDGPTAQFFMFMVQVATTEPVPPQVTESLAKMREPVRLLAETACQGQKEGSVKAGEPMQLSTLYWSAVQGLCCLRIAGSPISVDPNLLGGILLRD